MFHFQKRSFRFRKKTIVFKNEGLSLTIVNETTNFIKTVVFGKTIVFETLLQHATLLNVVLHEVKSCGELKFLDIILKTTQ